MIRPLVLSAFGILLAASVQGAGLKLEKRDHDTVRITGADKSYVGTIVKLDDNALEFRTLSGIRHTWPRSQVLEVLRKCTLQESYNLATKAAGNDPRAHLKLYEACLEVGLKTQAHQELEKAIKVGPKYLPAYSKLLEVARASNNLDMEIGTLEAATGAGIATVPMLIRKAEIYVRLGMVDNAEEPLKRALAINPFDTKADSRLAMIELIHGKPDRAEERVRRMLRRAEAKKDPHALVALGQLEFARGNLTKAAEAFEKATENAKSPAAAASLGAVLLRQGKVGNAGPYFAQARLLRPDFVPTLAGDGLVKARSGDLKKAAGLLDQAVAAAPRRADVLIARAYVSELAGEHAIALRMYTKALMSDRPNVYALSGAGRCQWKLGDAREARSFFLKALSLRPGFVPALRGLGRVALAGNPSQAAKYLRQVAESKSATPEDRAALAGALIRLQRFGEAAAELNRAGTDNVHGRIGLGFLAYAQGRADDARSHFAAAVKLGDYRGYAAAAIQRIQRAESRLAWSDGFERPDDPKVRNDWEEVEPPGVSISISQNSVLIDGKPTTGAAISKLSRSEGASFLSITAEASTGSEADSFVGVFVAPQGGQPVLFGRFGGGWAAILAPGGLRQPRLLARKIPQGKFTVSLEVDKAGRVRPLVDGKRVHLPAGLPLPKLAGATAYDVGLFALPKNGGNVNCRFNVVQIVRSK